MSDLTAVAALSPTTSLAGPGSSITPDVPSSGEIADFARAASLPAPEQVQALTPSNQPDLSQTVAQGFDGFVQRVQASQQSFGTGSPLTATSPSAEPVSSVQETIERSIGGMQHAYAFAIETTMASRGSTETTKIFNTLLKGQ